MPVCSGWEFFGQCCPHFCKRPLSGKFTRQNSITRVCSDIQGSPGQQTKTLNIQRDDFNMEIKVNSSENVRLEVEIEERSEDGSQGSESNFGLREESKNRLKRLGKLYAGKTFS